MKRRLAVIAVLLLTFAGASIAQEKQPATTWKPGAPPPLEAQVRKVWEAFKNKDKAALSALLDNGFRQVEEGSSGFGDKKAELAMVDEFQITTYTLKDFTVKSLAPNVALVTYLAHYEGKDGNETVNANTAYGEVWIRAGNTWKGFYTQETAMK